MKTTREMSQTLLWGTVILLLISIPVSHVAAQTCVPASSGLVSWWPGDGHASDIEDGNHGTLVAGATFDSGLVDEAFRFTGSLNSGVRIPSSANLNPAEAITLDAWVFPLSFPNGAPSILRREGNAGSTQYLIAVGDGNITGVAHCNIGDFAGGTGGVVALQQWTHVACTYDRQFVRLYVNGVEVAAQTATQLIPAVSHELWIGNHERFIRQFDGLIDEVAIYNRALSAAEIQSIFGAGSAGRCLDATPPTFGACPAGGPFLLNSGSQPVGPIAAEDPDSGIDTENSLLTGAVDTSAVGTQTVTFIAVNIEGSEATQDCDYDVHYNFSGVFQPIDNTLPNAAKAGQTIPVTWRLTDATGAPVADPQSFVNVSSSATPGACGGAADAIETYAGASGLQYLGDGYWQFNWKTPKAYAGQCRTMSLNLQDEAPERTAAFIFK